MPAFTQLIPNFLGGVSTQNDTQKLPNQLTECVNGFPDPTFGLLKRPSMKHTKVLYKANGTTAFTKTELADAAWFTINRSTAGSYIGCIKGTNIYVWRESDCAFCTVTNTGTSYLTGTGQTDYHFRSIQDTTIITNKTVHTNMLSVNSTHVANSVGTLKLTGVNNAPYIVTLQGDEVKVTPQTTETFDDMLIYDSTDVNTNHHLIDKLRAHILAKHTANDSDYTGRWYLEGYSNSIVIRRTNESNAVKTDYSTPGGTPVAFTLKAKGGITNDQLEAFQDEVTNVSKLPLESYTGHVVKIVNTDAAEDDYYVKFKAYLDPGGAGYWQETLAHDVSTGLNAATMPHALINTGATTFTFGPITWSSRLAGDDVTSPPPSFIKVNTSVSPHTYSGKKITSTFFYNNRFGLLSEDNVTLGVANDTYNLFAKSALTQVNSDPIDLNVSSVTPVILSDVLPSSQGLLLFSARQQFQLYSAESSVLTPGTATIRSMSNYEMDTRIAPAADGTASMFVSKVLGYSKMFAMELRDREQPPIVVDFSKTVVDWIPNTVDTLAVSPTNSTIILADRGTSNCYVYKYYNNGQENLFQAWTKWEMPGTIQSAQIIDDSVVLVMQHEDQYTLGKIILDKLPTGDVITTNTSYDGDPLLDMATRPVKPHTSVDAVVYDSTNDLTKIYVPYTPIADKEAAMLLAVPTADVGTDAVIDSDQGYWAVATERTETGTGYRYFEVKGDFSGYADGIIVGYNYKLEATFPKFYFSNNRQEADYTALLTVSRVKLSAGKGGAVTFKVKADGSSEWRNIQHTVEAGRYTGDTNPVTDEEVFAVPIHQRNTNFELKVTSNYPYPVSLVSMMWEGNYSPRFYRRA